MPNYGKYETARELSRGPLATVFVAHPSGKPGRDEFVVKAYVIGAQVTDQDEAKAQAKRFLARVSPMEAIAGGKGHHWAPVIDQGKVPTGAYYITRWYPRSVDQLISGRVRLDAGSLYNIVWSVYQGLREIQQHAGRPHGALKATNVLLDRVGQVASAKIVLTDPAPAGEIDPVTGELEDLRAVGRLIFQLVFFSEFRELGGWPIAESAEWNRLGKNGSAWRSLANRLLDPGAQPGSLTLGSIEGELRALREKAKGGGKKLVPIAVLLVLAGGVGAVVTTGAGQTALGWIQGLISGGGGEPAPGPTLDRAGVLTEVWRPWCDEAAWFEELTKQLTNDDHRAVVESDAFLMAGLVSMRGDYDDLDPRRFADEDSGIKLSVLASDENMPDRVLNEKGREKAQQGLDGLRRARLSLGGAGGEGETRWPARVALETLAAKADALGWERSKRVIDQFVTGKLDVFVGAEPTLWRAAESHAESIVALVERTERIEGLLGDLETIERTMPVLAGSGDPMLGRFEELVAGLDGSIEGTNLDRLDELDLRLGELAGLAQGLEDQIADAERFGGRLPGGLIEKRRRGAADPDAPSVEILDEYLVLIESWAPEPIEPEVFVDARESWGLYGRIKGVEQRLTGLGLSGSAGFGDRIKEIEEEIREIDNKRADVTRLPLASLADKRGIADAMALLDGRMDRVEGDLDQIDSERALAAGNTADFVKGVRGEGSISRYAIDAVDEAWRAGRDALLARHEADEDADALRRDVGGLRSVFATLEERFDGEATIDRVPSGFDAVELNRLVGNERVGAIERVGARVGFSDVAALQQALDDGPLAEQEAFKAWIGGIGPTLAAMRSIESRIDACEGLDEATGGSILVDVDALDAAALSPAVEAFVDRVAGLRGMAIESDPEVLIAAATAVGDVPMQMAAWRRLVRLEGWPGDAGELGRLASTMKRVRASVPQLADAELAGRLAGEVAGDGARAWAGLVESASTARQLREALVAGSSFDLTGTTLSARSRYNALASSLVGTIDSGDEQAAVAQLGSFVAAVRGLEQEGLVLTGAASEWIDKLGSIAGGEQVAGGGIEQLEDVGPGSRGWSIEGGSSMERVGYRSPSGQRVSFARLEDPRLPDPVYLATTEVSVGLFASVTEASGGYEAISTANGRSTGDLSRHTLESRWSGPVAWIWQSGGVVPSPNWLLRETQLKGEFVISPDLRVEQPTVESPMSFLKPQMAERFAELAGCRLPSPAEWEAAEALERTRGGGARWNLRDQTFGTQQRYMAQDFLTRAPREQQVWPDNGTYTGIATDGPRGAADDAAQIGDGDDGALWYMGVEAGGSETGSVFKHLVGNVAEFVKRGDDYFVMGSSAISAPEVLPSTPRGFKRSAIADTGFRLAFSAPGTTAQETLADAVERLMGERVFVLAE